MIPLRDANPTRRTPIVTLALIVSCFVVFAYELGRLGSGGPDALDAFAREWGIVPAELTKAWSSGVNLPGVEDAPPTVVWVSATALHQVLLEPVAPEAPSPSASAAPGASASSVPSSGPSAAP